MDQTFYTKNKIFVLCRDRLSFDTFMSLGVKKEGPNYIFVNSAADFKNNGMYSIKILDDFWDNVNRDDIIKGLESLSSWAW